MRRRQHKNSEYRMQPKWKSQPRFGMKSDSSGPRTLPRDMTADKIRRWIDFLVAAIAVKAYTSSKCSSFKSTLFGLLLRISDLV
ncbi:hypothetical protein OPQ81_007769 [Rhizoctonia solani]|nr:hypothetical protein OPQ81_007769 [Rhizoctonia solani]